jgi:hypothetical protein
MPSQAPCLLGLSVVRSTIRFLLGRWIREKPTKVERKKPRIAGNTAYLRDAYNRNRSADTRIRCAFNSVYFCCAEVAEMHGHQLEAMCHPTHDVVRIGLAAVEGTEEQLRTAESLADGVVTGHLADECRKGLNHGTRKFVRSLGDRKRR